MPEKSIYDDYSVSLTKEGIFARRSDNLFPNQQDTFVNAFSEPTPAASVVSGDLIGNQVVKDGFLQSGNFVSGSMGWKIDSDGSVEFGSGEFRGSITTEALFYNRVTVAPTFESLDSWDVSGNVISVVGSSQLLANSGATTTLKAENAGGVQFALDPTLQVNANFDSGVYADTFYIVLGDKEIGAGFKIISDRYAITGINATPTAGGTGYSLNDVLTVTSGSADATVKVTGESSGVVTSLSLVDGGSGGYTVSAGNATTGGGNNDCTVEITSRRSTEFHKLYSFFYDGSEDLSFIQRLDLDVFYTFKITNSFSTPTNTLKFYLDGELKQTRTFTFGADSDFIMFFEVTSGTGVGNRVMNVRNIVFTRKFAPDGSA